MPDDDTPREEIHKAPKDERTTDEGPAADIPSPEPDDKQHTPPPTTDQAGLITPEAAAAAQDAVAAEPSVPPSDEVAAAVLEHFPSAVFHDSHGQAVVYVDRA